MDFVSGDFEMVISHDREKICNAIIYFVQNTRICNKTKLMKLLYFLDFNHFRLTGKSVTGLNYYAFPMGPYPTQLGKLMDERKNDTYLSPYVNITKENDIIKIIPKLEFDDLYFSNRELNLLKSISEEYFDSNADEMIEATHFENLPWDMTIKTKGNKALIDYKLAFSKESEFVDEILENIKDREEIIAALDK